MGIEGREDAGIWEEGGGGVGYDELQDLRDGKYTSDDAGEENCKKMTFLHLHMPSLHRAFLLLASFPLDLTSAPCWLFSVIASSPSGPQKTIARPQPIMSAHSIPSLPRVILLSSDMQSCMVQPPLMTRRSW